MKEQDILKEAILVRGINQGELAKLAGYKTQSAISSRLYGKSIRVDTFTKLLSAMGFSVKVEGHGHTWIITEDTEPMQFTELEQPQQAEKQNTSQKPLDLDKLLSE